MAKRVELPGGTLELLILNPYPLVLFMDMASCSEFSKFQVKGWNSCKARSTPPSTALKGMD